VTHILLFCWPTISHARPPIAYQPHQVEEGVACADPEGCLCFPFLISMLADRYEIEQGMSWEQRRKMLYEAFCAILLNAEDYPPVMSPWRLEIETEE